MKTIRGQVRIGGQFEGSGAFEQVADVLAALEECSESTGATIQAFDARYVAGNRHLQTAVAHATRARQRDENVADDPAVEILLYAAGRRQIDQAMEMGLKRGIQPVVIVIDGGEEGVAKSELSALIEPAEPTGESDRITSFFGISERERAVTTADLETLVCERVVLLNVDK